MLYLWRNAISRSQKYVLLLPFLFIIGLNLLFYRQGYRLSPDSVYYVSVAKNFSDYGNFFGFDSNFLDQYPPVYSLVLYPGMFVSLNSWVFLINTLSGCILIGLFLSICRLLHVGHLRSIGLAFVFLSSVLYLEIYTMVWSETIFNAILLYVVFLVVRILSRPVLIHKDLVWLLIFIWLLQGTRYIGLVIIPVIFIFLLMKFRKPLPISIYCFECAFTWILLTLFKSWTWDFWHSLPLDC